MYFIYVIISVILPFCGISLLMTPPLLEFLMARRVTLRVQRQEENLLLGFIYNNYENNDDRICNNNQHM